MSDLTHIEVINGEVHKVTITCEEMAKFGQTTPMMTSNLLFVKQLVSQLCE